MLILKILKAPKPKNFLFLSLWNSWVVWIYVVVFTDHKNVALFSFSLTLCTKSPLPTPHIILPSLYCLWLNISSVCVHSFLWWHEKKSLLIMEQFTTCAKIVFNHQLCTFLFLNLIFIFFRRWGLALLSRLALNSRAQAILLPQPFE
jgi:hypothetical protein